MSCHSFASMCASSPAAECSARARGAANARGCAGLLGSRVGIALGRAIRDRGYHVHGWRLGRNLGPDARTVAGLGQRFVALRARHRRKVSLIGWSLGGIYARELARRFPADVRQVITLASPFRAPAASSVARFYPRRRSQARPAPRTPLDAPLPVPSSSLYSRSDGVVAWRSCLQDEGPLAENIEVRSSHCGMGHHPGALLVIAEI